MNGCDIFVAPPPLLEIQFVNLSLILASY